MARDTDRGGSRGTREDRLKAALRANLQRRKAQGRARTGKADDKDDKEGEGPEDEAQE